MSEEQKLLPRISQQTAMERRIAATLLKLSPGLGEKTQELAATLSDSGLSAAAANLLIQAVYSPNDAVGRGQGTRAKWFTAAIQNRYGHRLEAIRKDPTRFKNFVAEMEDVVEMRDTLNGEGIAISFESAFNLWEVGLNAATAMSTIQSICADIEHTKLATALLLKAARQVKAGNFMALETAIEFMRQGYDSAAQ